MRRVVFILFLMSSITACATSFAPITMEELESDIPRADDNPSTRGGGLLVSRRVDLSQINALLAARQKGIISDKAWARIIKRNPGISTFANLKPLPAGENIYQISMPAPEMPDRLEVDVHHRQLYQ